MSASLVGSEMCIRDSPFLPSPFRISLISCAAVYRPALTLERRYADRQDPVSYTHLTLPTICSV
eukprot:1763837-Alexandrium_andersonii.AAC.1